MLSSMDFEIHQIVTLNHLLSFYRTPQP